LPLTTLISRCIYQERPTLRLWTMSFPKSPAIQRILLRGKSLSAALKFIEGQGALSRVTIIELVERTLESFRPRDNASWVEWVAMGRIVGHPEHVELQPESTQDGQVFTTIGQAWIAWATGVGREEALVALTGIPVPEGPQPEGGALHLMALQPWAAAVNALFHDDFDEAQRWFRRATELASQVGSETNTAVQWTYAATYFGR